MKKFVGVDLHKKTIAICVVNKDQKVVTTKRFYCNQPNEIQQWFAKQGDFDVVVEATASYEWFFKIVEPFAENAVLAHPRKLRLIAESKRKSDKFDARVLAELLAVNMIPQAYRPTPRERQLRTLTRYRKYLVGRMTSVKNRIRNLLANYNDDRRNAFSKQGRRDTQKVDLLPADRFVLDDLYDLLKMLHDRLLNVQRALREFASSAPPKEKQARELLCTIPGVGTATADHLLAEAGDLERFGSQKKLTAYVGLVSGYRESAGKRKDLSITRTGPSVLRWIVTQAAWQLVRRDRYWQNIFENLAKRRGKKRAIIAVSRRLLCLMMSIVTNGKPYRAAA